MRNKKKVKVVILPAVVLIGLLAMTTSQLFAPYWVCGCTPGYWKNHLSEWDQTLYNGAPLMPTQQLATVFNIPGNLSALADDSLLQALRYPGGTGLTGGARILLRAAVAGLLNFTHVGLNNINSPCRGYYGFYRFYCFPEELPCMINRLVSEVGGALATGDRETIIQLARDIDIFNNMICPLGN